jgi:hypothetical protein
VVERQVTGNPAIMTMCSHQFAVVVVLVPLQLYLSRSCASGVQCGSVKAMTDDNTIGIDHARSQEISGVAAMFVRALLALG